MQVVVADFIAVISSNEVFPLVLIRLVCVYFHAGHPAFSLGYAVSLSFTSHANLHGFMFDEYFSIGFTFKLQKILSLSEIVHTAGLKAL